MSTTNPITIHHRHTSMDDNTKQRLIERLQELQEKSCRLVWYARSHPSDDPWWNTISPSIRTGALNSQAKVEEQYPDEIDKLKCPACGDWEHGYNSGLLAATRLVLAYLDPIIDEEEGFSLESSIEFAEDSFPELDT